MPARLPLSRRLATASRWPFGVALTSWRYMWRTVPMHRSEDEGSWPDDGPPELPDFKMPVRPGDHVVFPRSAGVWVEVEDERLLVCRVRELLGVIEEGQK